MLTNAGPEIGVASTKAFTTQLAALFLLAVKLGRLRGHAGRGPRRRSTSPSSREIPKLVEEALRCEAAGEAHRARPSRTRRTSSSSAAGPMHPVALEGALKLKEICYIHAEGYAGGEMKHGPIALIDENAAGGGDRAARAAACPTRRSSATWRRCGPAAGKVIAVVDEDDTHVSTRSRTRCIRVSRRARRCSRPSSPSVPLQLLAYHVADLRGNDVDQPRNLAKSVTVE